MKKIFSSVILVLISLPVASFACGDKDCGGMVLPPPEVPAPGPVENLLGSLSHHSGLFAGLALAAIVGFAVSRRVKLIETKSVSPSFSGTS